MPEHVADELEEEAADELLAGLDGDVLVAADELLAGLDGDVLVAADELLAGLDGDVLVAPGEVLAGLDGDVDVWAQATAVPRVEHAAAIAPTATVVATRRLRTIVDSPRADMPQVRSVLNDR